MDGCHPSIILGALQPGKRSRVYYFSYFLEKPCYSSPTILKVRDHALLVSKAALSLSRLFIGISILTALLSSTVYIAAREPSHTVGSDESTCKPNHTSPGAIEKKISFDKRVDSVFSSSQHGNGKIEYRTAECFAGKAKSEGGKHT